MYTVTKEFSIEYAHRLKLPYESKCSNLHGHSGKVQISISTDSLDENGMVIDFNELKNVELYITDVFDHSTILEENDELLENLVTDKTISSLVLFHGNPTSENLAETIVFDTIDILSNKLKKFSYWIVSCTFYETQHNWAKFTINKKEALEKIENRKIINFKSEKEKVSEFNNKTDNKIDNKIDKASAKFIKFISRRHNISEKILIDLFNQYHDLFLIFKNEVRVAPTFDIEKEVVKKHLTEFAFLETQKSMNNVESTNNKKSKKKNDIKVNKNNNPFEKSNKSESKKEKEVYFRIEINEEK